MFKTVQIAWKQKRIFGIKLVLSNYKEEKSSCPLDLFLRTKLNTLTLTMKPPNHSVVKIWSNPNLVSATCQTQGLTNSSPVSCQSEKPRKVVVSNTLHQALGWQSHLLLDDGSKHLLKNMLVKARMAFSRSLTITCARDNWTESENWAAGWAGTWGKNWLRANRESYSSPDLLAQTFPSANLTLQLRDLELAPEMQNFRPSPNYNHIWVRPLGAWACLQEFPWVSVCSRD